VDVDSRDYSRHFASRSTNDDRLANDPRTMERATTRCANALAMRRTCASMRASAKSARRATTKPARAGTIRCGAVQKMNAEELEIAMANRDRPMVIDFYATWCGPCVLMSSELEKVQEQLGDKVQCVKVDTDEESDLATQLQIQGLPTLVFVSTDSSKPALRTEGMLPAETVISVIENEL
jgi:thioredoxin